MKRQRSTAKKSAPKPASAKTRARKERNAKKCKKARNSTNASKRTQTKNSAKNTKTKKSAKAIDSARKPKASKKIQESKRATRLHPPAKNTFTDYAIQSPKRTADAQRGWDGFFPYYAGFPEPFARALLASARLSKKAIVLDPWNGSGTTTFAASQLGLASIGYDINPVMLIVARARLLARQEADSLKPLAREIIKNLRGAKKELSTDDPLLDWFTPGTAALLRQLEQRIQLHLIGEMTLSQAGAKLEHLSGLAATFYVALFSLCRKLVSVYQSSNPTWLRKPGKDEALIESDRQAIVDLFMARVSAMANALAAKPQSQTNLGDAQLAIADTAALTPEKTKVDFILTSPPYCTRIDYAAATRIELAVLNPLLGTSMEDLGRRMIGSTRVPKEKIARDQKWGTTVNQFLTAVKRHPSRASDTYYYKTHVDYFAKMYASLSKLSARLKDGGKAILVVQDSYYKDVHNDLAKIIGEMARAVHLNLGRREDHHIARSMAGVNPHSGAYRETFSATESVLCFQKS